MSAAEQTQGRRRRRDRRPRTPSLLDQVIAATRPQNDQGSRARPRTTSSSSSTRSSSPARSSPRTSRPTSSSGSARSTRSCPPSSTRSCTTPTSRSWKRPGAACTTSSIRRETGENLEDPRPERQQARPVQGPGKGRRVRPERPVQEDLRGRVRPARRRALRHAGRRLRVRPASRGHQPAEDGLQRGGRRPTPRSSPRPAPKLFNFDRFTELSSPRDLAKIFDSVEYAAWKSFRESEDSRYVALTLPHVLAPAALRRELQAASTSSTSRSSSTARTTTSTCG